jgi:hypothetical protein
MSSVPSILSLIHSGATPFEAIIVCDASRFSRCAGDEVIGELKKIAKRGKIYYYSTGERFTHGDFGNNLKISLSTTSTTKWKWMVGKSSREAGEARAKRGDGRPENRAGRRAAVGGLGPPTAHQISGKRQRLYSFKIPRV